MQQHYDVTQFEYVLWRHTMHEWVMNIHYKTWIAQGGSWLVTNTLAHGNGLSPYRFHVLIASNPPFPRPTHTYQIVCSKLCGYWIGGSAVVLHTFPATLERERLCYLCTWLCIHDLNMYTCILHHVYMPNDYIHASWFCLHVRKLCIHARYLCIHAS